MSATPPSHCTIRICIHSIPSTKQVDDPKVARSARQRGIQTFKTSRTAKIYGTNEETPLELIPRLLSPVSTKP
jgi:hypothetical protein